MLNLSYKTVEQLRKSNHKIKVHHFRHVKQDDGSVIENVPFTDIQDFRKVTGKGGKTEIYVTTPEGKNYKGESFCNPKDSFNYKLAVRIALGRLVETPANN